MHDVIITNTLDQFEKLLNPFWIDCLFLYTACKNIYHIQVYKIYKN